MYIDSALAINPSIAYLYQQKAMPYFKQGKYEVAMPILDKAVALDSAEYIDYRAFMKMHLCKGLSRGQSRISESSRRCERPGGLYHGSLF